MLVLSTLQDKSQQQTSQQDRAGGREESKKQEGRQTGKEGTHCQMFGRHVTCNPQFRKLETEKKKILTMVTHSAQSAEVSVNSAASLTARWQLIIVS